MEAVDSFIAELHSLSECKLPVSRQKISLVTKSAMRAIRLYKHVVQAVERYIAKCPPQYKIPGLYALDAIVRQSVHQFCEKDVFVPRFTRQLPLTIQNVKIHCDGIVLDRQALLRVLSLWQDAHLFDKDLIDTLVKYVQDPLNESPHLVKAQDIVDHITAKQLANKGHHHNSNSLQSSTHGVYSSSKIISSLPGPPTFENQPNPNSSKLNDFLEKTTTTSSSSLIATSSSSFNELNKTTSQSVTKNENKTQHDGKSLIHTVKMLLQKAGSENLNQIDDELENLLKSIIEQIHHISIANTHSGGELMELSYILSELVERIHSCALNSLNEAKTKAMLMQRKQEEKQAARRLLGDFDYDDDDEDDFDVANTMKEKERVEMEFQRAQWFASKVQEISQNLAHVAEQQTIKEQQKSATIEMEQSSSTSSAAPSSSWSDHNVNADVPPPAAAVAQPPPPPPPPPINKMQDNNQTQSHPHPHHQQQQQQQRYQNFCSSSKFSEPQVFDYGHQEFYEERRGSHLENDHHGLHHHDTNSSKRRRSSVSSGSSSTGGMSNKYQRRSNSRDFYHSSRDYNDHEYRRRRGMPAIKSNRISVLSHTVFIGRLHKLMDESKLRELVDEIGPVSHFQHIPPRGCAFVTYQRRKHAAKALNKLHKHRLDGRAIRVEWAPNKGISEDQELKQYWQADDGCSYIPDKKFPLDNLDRILEGGAEIDIESIPFDSQGDNLKEAIQEREKKIEEMEKIASKKMSLLPTPALNLPPPPCPPGLFYPPPPPPITAPGGTVNMSNPPPPFIPTGLNHSGIPTVPPPPPPMHTFHHMTMPLSSMLPIPPPNCLPFYPPPPPPPPPPCK